MTLSLCFDTETTGICNFKSVDHTVQPYPVQLAMELFNDEKLIHSASIIINPGVPVPEPAYKVHGISTEVAELYGIQLRAAAGLFINFILKADRLVGHNIDFDIIVMEAAIHRSELNFDLAKFRQIPRICTMKSTTNLLKLPGKFGNYKWPTLEEAYKHLVDPDGFSGAHDAMSDVRATKAVLSAIEKMDIDLKSGDR